MGTRNRIDLPDRLRVEKTVFVKAPGNMPHGRIMRVVDGPKGAGAEQFGLQLDDLK